MREANTGDAFKPLSRYGADGTAAKTI